MTSRIRSRKDYLIPTFPYFSASFARIDFKENLFPRSVVKMATGQNVDTETATEMAIVKTATKLGQTQTTPTVL